MCLALYIPPNVSCLNELQLREAYRANPDGCGFMWDCGDGQIHIDKGMYSFASFWTRLNMAMSLWPKNKFVVHFRSASASAIGDEYCHPFLVNDKLAFVHNGNLPEFGLFMQHGTDKRSDTQRFNDKVLKRLPKNFLNNRLIRDALKKYCVESMSKLIFMNSQGEVAIINESAGYWKNGIWYSNGGIKNYTGYGFSGAYAYQKGDVRHKGGLLTVQMFEKKERMKWRRCEACLGWYPKGEIEEELCNGCRTLRTLTDYAERREA